MVAVGDLEQTLLYQATSTGAHVPQFQEQRLSACRSVTARLHPCLIVQSGQTVAAGCSDTSCCSCVAGYTVLSSFTEAGDSGMCCAWNHYGSLFGDCHQVNLKVATCACDTGMVSRTCRTHNTVWLLAYIHAFMHTYIVCYHSCSSNNAMVAAGRRQEASSQGEPCQSR